jgi:hypothetical protein
MKRVLSLFAAVMLFSIVGSANLPNPNNSKNTSKKSIQTTMMIHLKSDATEAKLIIPRSQIQQLRAQLEELDNSSENTAAVVSSGGITRTQTIVSGLFLSMAIVFGGIWFVRSGKNASKTVKIAAIAVLLLGTGSVATLVLANAGPPPEARSITGKMFAQGVHIYGFGSGQIKLEAAKGDQDYIDLIVPDPKTSSTPDE